jgi:hypothetical protein
MAEPSTPRQTGCSIDELLHHLWNANRNARKRCRQLLALLREARINGPQALVQLEQRHVTEQEMWQVELAAVKKDRDQLANAESEQSSRVQELQHQLAECNQRLTNMQVELESAQDSATEANCCFENLQNQYNDTLGELELASRQLEEMAHSVQGQVETCQERAVEDKARNGQRELVRADSITVSIKKGSNISDLCEDSVDEAISRINQLAYSEGVDAAVAGGQVEAGAVEENPQKTLPIAPASFIEQYADIIEENIESEELARENSPAQSTRSSQRTQATVAMPDPVHDPVDEQTEASEDHTSVLEAYMTGLLNRVCGVGQQASASGPSMEDGQENQDRAELRQPSVCVEVDLNERSDTSGCPNGSTQTVDQSKEEVVQEPVTWLELEDLKQSSCKPTLPADMGAMRHLANNSARKALADYGANRYRNTAVGKLLACCAAALAATILMLWSDQPGDGAFIGGCVAVVIGLICAFQLLHVLLKVVRSGSWNEDGAVD